MKTSFFISRIATLFLFFIAYINVPLATGQNLHLLTGTLYNAETDQPVAGAHVVVTGINTPADNHSQPGTSTDPDGNFELNLPSGTYEIQVSFVGFSDETLIVNIPEDTAAPLRIGLQPVYVEMEDLFVFGEYFLPERDTSITREPVSLAPAISRIGSVEIERQGAVTITDAIKYTPGGLTETRGRKTKQFFSIRGQRYPYPDYSIDGIWQKEFEETAYFFSALDIESIEIVRSANAIFKGLTALSGVVEVRTRRPERETVSASVRYGQQNNYATNLRYGNRVGDLTFNVAGSFFGADGPPGRRGEERIANFHGTLDWKITPGLNLSAGSTYIDGRRDFLQIVEPGTPNLLNREEAFDPIRTLLTYAKLDYEGEGGTRTELQTNLAYRNPKYRSYNIPDQTSSSHREQDFEYGVHLLHSRPLTEATTIRIGGLYNYWIAPEGKRYYAGRRSNVHTWSGVVAGEHRTGDFVFDAGFRLIGGHIVEFGGFGIEGSAAGLRQVAPIEDQAAPVEWQSVLGATWLLTRPISLHYNFAGGAIAPRRGSMDEQGSTPGNETRLQHDLGLIIRALHQTELSVSTFFTQRRNALGLSGETVETEDGDLMELYENVDRRSYGVELSGRLNIPDIHSYLFANATLMQGQYEAGGGMESDPQLPNIILNFGVLFNYSGLDVNLYMHHTGPYTNNRFVNPQWISENGDYHLGDFYSLDLTTGYTIHRGVAHRGAAIRIFAEARNILDQRYETVAAYPDPGRLFSTGVSVEF